MGGVIVADPSTHQSLLFAKRLVRSGQAINCHPSAISDVNQRAGGATDLGPRTSDLGLRTSDFGPQRSGIGAPPSKYPPGAGPAEDCDRRGVHEAIDVPAARLMDAATNTVFSGASAWWVLRRRRANT